MPRAPREEHEPGTPAPQTGLYQLANVLGSLVGKTVPVDQGQPLPPAPRGFRWVLRPIEEC